MAVCECCNNTLLCVLRIFASISHPHNKTNPHEHTHARAHTHTPAHIHTCTHIHTHIHRMAPQCTATWKFSGAKKVWQCVSVIIWSVYCFVDMSGVSCAFLHLSSWWADTWWIQQPSESGTKDIEWNARVKPSFVNRRTAQTLNFTTYTRTYTPHAHTHTQLDTQNIHKGSIKVRGSSQSTEDATPLTHLTFTVHMSVIASVSVPVCLCLIV